MIEGPKIVILDDCYPYAVSGFRLAEYNYLLHRFPDAHVISSLQVLDWLDHDTSKAEVEQAFSRSEPVLARRVTYSDGVGFSSAALERHFRGADLIYTIFLNNAIDLIPVAEKYALPFVFTLYPGGGLHMTDPTSQAKLIRVLTHPLFAGVIVTQPHTLQEIRRRFPELERRQQLQYVFGGVLQDPPRGTAPSLDALNPDQLNICFIANRYEPNGLDKGIDVFVDAVIRLSKSPDANRLRFHAVGPWTSEDMRDAAGLVALHGQVPNADLPDLLSSMDIAVFPTRAGLLGAGSFDGFPVGAAIEAGKSGVAVVSTNPLKQKTPLRRGESYVQIRPTARSVTKALQALISDPARLGRIRAQGHSDFWDNYSLESQMRPRIEFLATRARKTGHPGTS